MTVWTGTGASLIVHSSFLANVPILMAQIDAAIKRQLFY